MDCAKKAFRKVVEKEAFERGSRLDLIFQNLYASVRSVSEERFTSEEGMNAFTDAMARLSVNIVEHEFNILLDSMEANYV